mmetsp:Transcript_51979/g.116619  ORF Transcript_51979/g.116619 Transcript_51979/m.116619 type:complete len:650 (+) Transcript_51979:3-1952(+)
MASFAGGPDVTKIHRRVTWLNTNVFQDKRIDPEAVQALLGIGAARSMELLKDLEEKAEQIKTPSNYLKAAVSRQAGPPAGVPQGVDEAKVHRRATWLSTNVFQDRPISGEAVAAMLSLGTRRALELFKDVEEKADQIKNPSRYLIGAAARENPMAQPAQHMMPPVLAPAPQGNFAPGRSPSGVPEDQKIQRRAGWLNTNVFPDRPIDDEAIAAMHGLGAARAMELFKDVEEKRDQVRNPSGYLKSAAAREGGAMLALPPAQHSPMPMQGMLHGPEEEAKIHRRATWLNANVFPDRKINQEAIEAMKSLGAARAMELFKDVEEKGEQVKNPSNYLKSAAARESAGFAGPPVATHMATPHYEVYEASWPDSRPATLDEQNKIHRKVTWLNANIFPDRKIDDEAIGAMYGLGLPRAMKLLQETQEKAGDLRNPGNWLKAAAMREGLVPPGAPEAAPQAQMHSPRMNNGHGFDQEEVKIRKRATWLNANVFPDRRIDDEAVFALGALGAARAMELFKEVEEKADQLRSPGGYLKAAAARETQAPVQMASTYPTYAAGKGGNSPDYAKLRRRITWLNANVFVDAPLDAEAIEALASLPRAFDLLKDVESKAAEVKSPSNYVKAAARREHMGVPAGGFKRAAPVGESPAAKRRWV